MNDASWFDRCFRAVRAVWLSNGAVLAAGLLGPLIVVEPAAGQGAALRLKQLRDNGPVEELTAAERAALGDPLFNLLLKDKANLVKLADIDAALQGNAANRHLFVVDERIVSRKQDSPRRAVLAYSGVNGSELLTANVMLSVSFGPGGFAEITPVEGWGWDNHRERYNYYKLDGAGGSPGSPVWKFRASSVDADLLSPAERSGTCLACHVTGAPIMKELFFPWNHWHAGPGGSIRATYLVGGTADAWPAATTPKFAELKTADALETNFLMVATRRFNAARLNAALKRDDETGNRAVNAQGQMTVVDGSRLLRPLFETVEINLYSSGNTSGQHPFGLPTQFIPSAKIGLPPEQFFLNSDLIGDGGALGLESAGRFATLPPLTQQENKLLLDKFKLRLNNVPGDAHFAWLVPGAAFIDNDLARQCLKLGVVTPHFLAAVMAVDLENPVFSQRRAELLAFVPEAFDFSPLAGDAEPLAQPRDPAADLLTKHVIARIDQAEPPAGSAAAEFRELLLSDDALAALDARVAAYADRVEKQLTADAPARTAELERLFQRVIDRRLAMRAHPVLRNLDETGGQLLFPLPAP